jgi:hypothetical protein
MLYVLLLEQEKVYVGYSGRKVGERFLEHFNANGSKWTMLFRPLQVLSYQDGGPEAENKLTLDMMEKYGWWNVRGGSWCNVDMKSCPPALLERQQLRPPRQLRCSKNQEISKSAGKCNRCGRENHYATQCYAKTNIEGVALDHSLNSSSESSISDEYEGCFRCGRDSHFVRDCFASTDINGARLA